MSASITSQWGVGEWGGIQWGGDDSYNPDDTVCTFGAHLGFSCAVQITKQSSASIGAQLGFSANPSAQFFKSSTFGATLGFSASALNTTPTSVSISSTLGLTASRAMTGADSIAPGVELGFSTTTVRVDFLTASIGNELGFAAAEALTAPVSVAANVKLGITTTSAIAGVASIQAGTKLGFLASCKLILPVSRTIGLQLGTRAAITYPLSHAVGVELGTTAARSMHGHPAATIGVELGFSAFAGTSVSSKNVITTNITDPGSGFTSEPTVTIGGASGTPVSANAQIGAVGTPQAGQIINIIPQTSAGNLTGPLTVTITGGGGSGATASAALANPLSGSLGGSTAASGAAATAATGQTGQQQPLQVRAESYGVLTIETLTLLQGQPNQLLPPPIRQPDAQQVPPGQTQETGDTPNVQSRPWNSWYEQVYRALNPASSTVQFLCPSADETDSEWYATGSIDGKTDPVTFTATLVNESRFGMVGGVIQGGTGYSNATVLTVASQDGSGFGAVLTPVIVMGTIVAITTVSSGYDYTPPLSLVATDTGGGSGAVLVVEMGRQFGVGDFILWNDPTITAGVLGYEIDQITAIVPIDATHASFTVSRNPGMGAPADLAQYGSPIDAHSNVAFYRLINKLFVTSANPQPGPQICKFPWDNMTVAAVTALLPGCPPYQINLAPAPYIPGTKNLNPRTNPPAPGLRTMNGAAYTNLGIIGGIGVGQTSSARVSVQAHESIRTVYAKVTVAPTGPTTFNGDANACIVIYVCYLAPDGVTVGLIDTLVIDATEFNSYSASNVPDGRQMPYHVLWPFTKPNADWPPNRLPVCAGALTTGGLLQLPITPSGSSTVLFTPDGQIDFIVSQVGTTTAGGNLTVTIQT